MTSHFDIQVLFESLLFDWRLAVYFALNCIRSQSLKILSNIMIFTVSVYWGSDSFML